MDIDFQIAALKDARELTAISVAAFHTDFIVAGRKSEGGPPGYDSIEFHTQMIREAFRFYKMLIDGTIIGGFWFIRERPQEAYLHRIFVDPRFHRRGVGSQAFDFLLRSFPDIKLWSLKVPIWNSRTPNFYRKLGFEIKERSDRFIFLSKEMRSVKQTIQR